MSKGVTKAEFVENIRRARAEWDGLVEQIKRQQMRQPGFCGNWSLKDVIAHITWYEREMIEMLKTRALAGSSLWELPTDERNALIFKENEDLELERALEESHSTFLELINQLALLDDEDLNDPARFPGMPSDWRPWEVIASNTYQHYQAHIPHARAWLAK